MRIAYLYQANSTDFSKLRAAPIHIFHTIRGLQHAGHQVGFLTLCGREAVYTTDLEIFEGSAVTDEDVAALSRSGAAWFRLLERVIGSARHRLGLPFLGLFQSYRMVDACHQNDGGWNILHERHNLMALGGTLASRQLGIPLVLEVNADMLAQREFKGTPERGLRRWFAVWATRFAFDTAARIICVSSDLKEHLANRWGVDEARLVVLPCAADVETFGRGYDQKGMRRQFGLDDEPVIMWVGGFYPWHDLDLLIDSFRQVLRTNPKARLFLVGDGVDQPQIESKVRREGLENAVTMTGRTAHTKVPELLSIADVAVAPDVAIPASKGGTGTPLKLFEYMAAGKPIVSTASVQASAVLQHGETGLLTDPGDVEAFAIAIIDLLNNPGKRDRLGRNGRRTAIAYHSWEHYTTRLEQVYRSISEG